MKIENNKVIVIITITTVIIVTITVIITKNNNGNDNFLNSYKKLCFNYIFLTVVIKSYFTYL